MISKIIENKRIEVEKNKKYLPLDILRHKLSESDRDFEKAITEDKLNLIGEVKRKCPSNDMSKKKFSLAGTVGLYNKYANAISVLTDNKFFKGRLYDLKTVKHLSHLPVLRKDFIIDKYQIYESRFYGADAILLIASILTRAQIEHFITIAKGLNMALIVEVHDESELNKVLETKAKIIGINNRNLTTLEIDTATTLKLIDKIPYGKIIVSESGITSNSYVKKLAGRANAILVGGLFMNSPSPEKEIRKLIEWQE
jgi:indole-3-glycerol phosphate synthase